MPRQLKPIDKLTTSEFQARFPDDDACRRYLMRCRWPGRVHCPRCGNADVYDISSFKPFHWQCHTCNPNGYRFSVLVGTIFQNKHSPLIDWFRVIHLMLRGESVAAIRRMMDFGSKDTASAMYRRVQAVVAERAFDQLGHILDPEIPSRGVFSRAERLSLARRAAGVDSARPARTR
jgi:transposase-like protein